MKKKYIIGSTILIIIVLCILFVLVLTCALKQKTKTNSLLEINRDSVEPGSDISSQKYRGRYLESILYEDWKIQEYYDEEGMSFKSEGVYSGLTGFEIFKNNKVVFSFKGVNGIGIIDVCDPIYQFSDTDPMYIEDMKNRYLSIVSMDESKQANVIFLGNEYNTFSIFDKEVRRIDSSIYWKRSTNVNYFDPYCGGYSEVLQFEDIKFYAKPIGAGDEARVEINTYKAIVEDKESSEEDMQTLQKILDSLELIKK